MGILLLVIGYLIGLSFMDSGIGGLIIAIVVWVIMSLVAYFQGDNIFLSLSRARKIGRDDHPRLYNIVEEMKIASGLEKMPDIYIIDDPALNAFATGRDPNKAAVAITSGLLQKLNRDELQGVIAHEISHVINRDVLLMVMCGVLLGTIVILAWLGTRMLFFGAMTGGGRRSSRSSGGGGGGQAQVIIMIVALVLMILAPIAARFIYLAISRKREYLADASAALYTRYPEGLASALEKLAASTTQLKAANQATASMYITNPFRKKGMAASNLSSTHPPISERIRILRAMSGASLDNYNQAYLEAHHSSKGVIPAANLATAGAVGLRGAEPEVTPEPDKVGRTRETSDLVLRLNNYKTIDCTCGTKLKVPPKFKGANIRCPHCGRMHPIQQGKQV
jgi:heat shock protein HtpX